MFRAVALSDPKVGDYLKRHFVATFRQVADFEVVSVSGRVVKNGGNVAAYFRTPDGLVIHAVTGPVEPTELLAEASWAVKQYRAMRDFSPDAMQSRIAAAHLAAASKNDTTTRLHQLLARMPFQHIDVVYSEVFAQILGERTRKTDSRIVRAVEVVRRARDKGRPMLFLLHRQPDNQMVERQWRGLMKRTSSSKTPMRLLADCYCVIGLPLRELPALSTELGVPPFSVPRHGGPMIVVTNSRGEQVGTATGWQQSAPDLVTTMARGLAFEAIDRSEARDNLDLVLQRANPRRQAEVYAMVSGIVEEFRRLAAQKTDARPMPLEPTTLRNLLRLSVKAGGKRELAPIVREMVKRAQAHQRQQRRSNEHRKKPNSTGSPQRTRLTANQFDRGSGVIHWPPLLKDTQFAKGRSRLDTLFAQQPRYGSGLDSQKSAEAQEVCDQIETTLRKMIRECETGSYIAAKKFLAGLAYEAQFIAEPIAGAESTGEHLVNAS